MAFAGDLIRRGEIRALSRPRRVLLDDLLQQFVPSACGK
jgi:hypothetical protein